MIYVKRQSEHDTNKDLVDRFLRKVQKANLLNEVKDRMYHVKSNERKNLDRKRLIESRRKI